MTLAETLLEKLAELAAGRRRPAQLVARRSRTPGGRSTSPPTGPTSLALPGVGTDPRPATADAPAGLTLKAWADADRRPRRPGCWKPLKLHRGGRRPRRGGRSGATTPAPKGDALAVLRGPAVRADAGRRPPLPGGHSRRHRAASRSRSPLTHEVLAKLAGDIAG